MSDLDFSGKVALITGAGSGLGKAYAKLLAARGAAVVINDPATQQDENGRAVFLADACAEEIQRSGGKAIADHGSVTDTQAVEAMVAAALQTFGGLDIVINNAGISANTPFEDAGLEEYERLMDVHFYGTVRVIKAAWPALKRSANGRIVNTLSSGILGMPGKTAYGAAKGAILAFTKSLMVEAADTRIGINAIVPGAATNMTMTSGHDETFRNWIEKTLPVSAVAPVVAYLAHESCTLRGEILSAAGGAVARYLIGETEGIRSTNLSIEQVARDLGAIMDAASFVPYADTMASVERTKTHQKMAEPPEKG